MCVLTHHYWEYSTKKRQNDVKSAKYMLQNIQNAIVGVSKKQYLCTRNQNNTIFFVP